MTELNDRLMDKIIEGGLNREYITCCNCGKKVGFSHDSVHAFYDGLTLHLLCGNCEIKILLNLLGDNKLKNCMGCGEYGNR